jgi:DNA polymerase III alpha subunit (gram-positive type)
VLVGHGVGFDVAILDRERRALGLSRLDNPVIDTRALSAALHPAVADHELDAVAARLGVPVVARHTAEGDALTAGRVLLGLLPDLRAAGVRTLRDLLRFQRAGSEPF